MGKKIKITLGSRAPKSSKSAKSAKSFRPPTTKRPQKGPKRPLPQQRRDSTSSLSSAPNLSDEDGYSAVEDMLDSDDDEEEHVFKAEMEHIISLQQQSRSLRQQNPRLQPQNSARSSTRPVHSSDDEAGDVENGAADDESEGNMTDEGSESEGNFSSHDDSSVRGSSFFSSGEDVLLPDTISEQFLDQPPPTRHVRFAGVSDTDSGSEFDEENDHEDLFPDIFVDQRDLDPGFRREIETDPHANSDSSDAFWDYADRNSAEQNYGGHDVEDVPLFGEVPQEGNALSSSVPEDVGRNWPYLNFDAVDQNSNAGINDSPSQQVNPVALSEDGDGSSDGYESDGETTEEDEPVLIPCRRTTPDPPVHCDASPVNKGKSPAGRLLLRHRNKPICILNPHTRKMMIIPPQQRPRITVPQILAPFPSLDHFGIHETMVNAAQSSSSKNLEDVWLDTPLFGPIFRPAATQFPNFHIPEQLKQLPESEESWNEEEEAENDSDKFDMEAFIDMSGLSDDGATEDKKPAGDEGDVEGPTTAGVALYQHLHGTGRVGAFRKNQDNQKLISNGVATQESLAFSNPLYHGTLRGIKQGNLQGASTPLTPERRPKRSMFPSMETSQGKRKVSEVDERPRKRPRTFTDATQS